MTLPAILTKLILVRIIMTIGAVSKLKPPEFLKHFAIYRFHLMTLYAINTLMLPGKLESGRGMVKLSCRLKRFRSMTIQADR